MKVAVISAVPTLGKTALIEILGGVYSRSQGRDVVILSTGNGQDNIECITNYTKTAELDNPYVVKSMIENSAQDATELLNYGTQAGDEHVYIYDVMSSIMQEREKEEFLLACLETLPAHLTLVEIVGDVQSDLNKKVMERCDCSIILVDGSQKSIRMYKELLDKLPKGAMRLNKAVVHARYDTSTVSDKKFAEMLGINVSEMYRFPYNANVKKLMLSGELDRIVYNILVGDFEVVGFRVPMQELMEFIFNTPTRKIIRSIAKWYK